MSSPAYMDKNSDIYAMAERYLKMFYPGMVGMDATGRMKEPEYDMTLEQFNKAQADMNAALEEAISDAESEYEKETGEPAEFDKYIELEETIDVRVLMPDGTIENKQLEVYTLDLPEDDDDTPNGKPRNVWRWHSEDGENTCSACASRDGEIYDSADDIPEIPFHPNCRCRITEDVIDPDGRTLSSKPYSPKKPTATPETAANTPAEKATFEKPVDTKPGQYAVFDGKSLTIYDDGEKVAAFAGVSGKPGYQSPEYQNKKYTGPIPEGVYVIRKDRLQLYKDIDRWDRQLSALGRGTWRGGGLILGVNPEFGWRPLKKQIPMGAAVLVSMAEQSRVLLDALI